MSPELVALEMLFVSAIPNCPTTGHDHETISWITAIPIQDRFKCAQPIFHRRVGATCGTQGRLSADATKVALDGPKVVGVES